MGDLVRILLILAVSLGFCHAKDNNIKPCNLGDYVHYDVHNIDDCIQYAGKIFHQTNQDSAEAFLLKMYNNTTSKQSFLIRMPEYFYPENALNSGIHNLYSTNDGHHFFAFELFPGDTLERLFYGERNMKNKPVFVYYSDKKLLPILTFETENINFLNGLIIYGLIFILSFMALMIFGGFMITRNAAYAYYTGYVFVLFSYFIIRFLLFQWYSLHEEDETKYYVLFNSASQPVFYIFYGKFVQHIINTKENYPLIHKVLNQFILLSFFSACLIPLVYYFHEYASLQVFNVYRIIAIGYSYFLIYSIYKTGDKLGKYIVTGTLMLVTGAMLAMFFSFYKFEIVKLYPINFFNLGIILELLFFTLGLAQKTAIETGKKLEAQMALNKILKDNELLQSHLNEQLSVQLETAKNEILIEQEQKINTQLELKRKESELAILLNQLNPHFIFNSLNSLKKYIVKEEKNVALLHIDQFSQLIRNFLEFSREKNVPISEIIKNLKLYVDLESKRIGKIISFIITISPDIEPEFDEIPALLMQPFIENAILHGVSHPSIQSPEILLDFSHDHEYLCITISDNGVGRKATYQETNDNNNLGLATKITEATIDLLNNESNGLTIEDLYHTDMSPAGTKVTIKLKKGISS